MGTAPLPRRILRVLSWHRRKLAAVVAAFAVLAAVQALAPPAPPTVAVVLTARAVVGGERLGVRDLVTVQRPAAELPDGARSEVSELVGQLVAAPLPRGQVLTDLDLVGPRQAGPGRVLAPLRLPDADLAASLRPGDVVDVVSADQQTGRAEVVVRGARVVTVPAALVQEGLLSSSGPSSSGGPLCLVDLPSSEAAVLAGAALRGQLSVVWPH